jgi:hypothetical protein
VNSDFVTDKIKVFVTIPDSREIPENIFIKLINTGNTKEYREAAVICGRRVSKTKLEGIVVMYASAGRPRTGESCRQKAEITLNFRDHSEKLICPINRTTTFNMCFYEAYEAQNGRPATVQSISACPDTPDSPDTEQNKTEVTVTELNVSIPCQIAGEWHNKSLNKTLVIKSDGRLYGVGYAGEIVPPSTLGFTTGIIVYGAKDLWKLYKRTYGGFSYNIKGGKMTVKNESPSSMYSLAFPEGKYEKR